MSSKSFDLRGHPRYDVTFNNVGKKFDQTKMQSQKIGDTRIRVNGALKQKAGTDPNDIYSWLIATAEGGAQTVYDCWKVGLDAYPDNAFLGDRKGNAEGDNEFKWQSYKQCEDKVNRIASAMVQQLGQTDKSDKTLVGMFAGNCWEWTLTGIALTCNSQVMVPLYDTLGPEAMRYITNQCEFEVMFIDNEKRYKSFVEGVQNHEDGFEVKHVVVFEKLSAEAEAMAKGFKLHYLSDIMANVADMEPHCPPSKDSIFVINFTSGTTGNPKGVMLSHGAWTADMCAAASVLKAPVGPTDSWLSYLPAAHVFERVIQTVMMVNGGCIGFFGGDARQLVADAGALRPTVFGAVPRVWNKIFGKLQAAQNESWLKGKIVGLCINNKVKNYVEQGQDSNATIYDKVVFKKIQALLGGRVKIAVSGAAPIKIEVLNTIRAALGCPIQEGYGQTETAAASTLTVPGDSRASVGVPVPCCAVKLESIPDMKYYADKDGQEEGEILIKGFNVMKGYYKNQEKTDDTIDKDGWVHTGDVGRWNANGTLSIIDRKKHIFKLSQGEYIAPEKIENVYITHPAVAQFFLHGNSERSKLVGVCFPDPEGGFKQWVDRHTFGHLKGNETMAQLCADDVITDQLTKELRDLGRGSGLHGFENVTKMKCHPEVMTVEAGLLTPTMKAKRPQIKEAFIGDLDALYTTIADN